MLTKRYGRTILKLYLMRHGHALSQEADPQHGLSEHGIAAVSHIAGMLAARKIHLDQIIHSTKKRARQTAEIVRSIAAREIECTESDEIKPNDDPQVVFNKIQNEKIDSLIVSHLPFIPGLLHLLCPTAQPVMFEPGTVVCLEKNSGNWVLLWVEHPKLK
jgi:phosphohistidine phosphatase